MARKNTESPRDPSRDTDPRNAGENAAVNDPNIDASGEKLGKAGAKQQRQDKVDRQAEQPSQGSC